MSIYDQLIKTMTKFLFKKKQYLTQLMKCAAIMCTYDAYCPITKAWSFHSQIGLVCPISDLLVKSGSAPDLSEIDQNWPSLLYHSLRSDACPSLNSWNHKHLLFSGTRTTYTAFLVRLITVLYKSYSHYMNIEIVRTANTRSNYFLYYYV